MFTPDFGRKRQTEPTECELKVIDLKAQGLTDKAIGKAICRSASTIKCHIESVRQKLDAKNATHAVVLCIKRGYVH